MRVTIVRHFQRLYFRILAQIGNLESQTAHLSRPIQGFNYVAFVREQREVV